MFESLSKTAVGFYSTAKYGYIVDDNQEPYKGEPILFFAQYEDSADAISFRDNDTSNSHSRQITGYLVMHKTLTKTQILSFGVLKALLEV